MEIITEYNSDIDSDLEFTDKDIIYITITSEIVFEGAKFLTYKDFVSAVENLGKENGFTTCLDSKKTIKKSQNINNSYYEVGEIRWRDIVCSCSGNPPNNENKQLKRKRHSKRCNCPFLIRGILCDQTGLWVITKANMNHNHDLIPKNLIHFLPNQRSIPEDIQQKIMSLRAAGVDIPTIRNILRHEHGDMVTWIYDDLYNFCYNHGILKERKNFDAQEFVNLLNQEKENDNIAFFVKINEIIREFEGAI